MARRLGVPRVEVFDEVGSTLDVAHELAGTGAPAGTVIVADAQTAGRGRHGRTWRSDPGAGVWLTVIERPAAGDSVELLSLRAGLAMAPALDALAGETVRLKWPNDLFLGDRKLAGILIEARWREGRPDWVAIGVGINLRPPADQPRAAGLQAGTSRDDVLSAIVPSLRAAARHTGPLSDDELAAFAERDLAAGRTCREPVAGVVQGIDSTGSLLVNIESHGSTQLAAIRAGSLVLQDDQ